MDLIKWFQNYWQRTSSAPWWQPPEVEPQQLSEYEIDVVTGRYTPQPIRTPTPLATATPVPAPDVPPLWPGYSEQVVDVWQRVGSAQQQAQESMQELAQVRENMETWRRFLPPDVEQSQQMMQEAQETWERLRQETQARFDQAVAAGSRAAWRMTQLAGLASDTPPEGLEYQPSSQDVQWLTEQRRLATAARVQEVPTIAAPQQFIGPITAAAQAQGIDPAALAALISWESGFNPQARGDSGLSLGLGQIHMPAHPDVTEAQAFDPNFAIPWTAQFFANLVRRFSDPANVHEKYRGMDPYYLAAAGYGGPAHIGAGTVPSAQWRRAEYVLAALGGEPGRVPTPPHISDLAQQSGDTTSWANMTEQEIRDLYTQRHQRAVRLYSDLSQQEIIKALSEFGGPYLPDDMTADDYIALYQKFEVTDSDLAKELAERREYMKTLVDEANQWEQARLLALQGIQTIPSPSFTDYIGKLISTPGGVALNVLNTYFRMVTNPIAGLATQNLPVLRPLLGAAYGDFERRWHEVDPSMNPWNWTAAGRAWEDADVPVMTRLMIEMAVDPVNWLTMALGPAKMIPKVGKYAGVLEHWWLAATDIPFLPLKAAWKAIPKLPGQRAAEATRDFLVSVGDYVRQATNNRYSLGTRGGTIPADELQRLLHEAVDYTLEHPDDMSVIGDVGRGLLLDEPPTQSKIETWATMMGRQVPAGEEGRITRQTLADITDILDKMEGTGTVYMQSRDEAADLIMRKLGIQDTNQNLPVMRRILDAYRKDVAAEAKRVASGQRTGDIVRALADRYAEKYAKLLTSDLARHQAVGGAASAFVRWIDKGLQSTLVAGLDRLVVMPLARLYLMTVSYGPLNLLETASRSWISGGGFSAAPWRSHYRGVINRMSIITHGHEARIPWVISRATPTLEALGRLQGESVRDWTQRIGVGRFRPFQVANDLFIDLPGRLGTYQQADFITNVMLKNMKSHDELGPVIDQIDDILRRTRMPEQVRQELDPRLADLIETEFRHALTAGPEPARRLIREGLSPESIDRAKVEAAIGKLELIPNNVKQGILDTIESGRLWSLGADGVERLADRIRDGLKTDYLRTPEFWSQRWKAWIDDEMATPITNAHDLMTRAVAVDEAARAYEEMLENYVMFMQRETRSIRDMEARERQWNNYWRRLSGFLDETPTFMQAFVGILTDELELITDLTLRAQVKQHLDSITGRLLAVQRARQQSQAVQAARRAATPVHQRRDAWYAETIRLADVPWEHYRNERLIITRNDVQAMAGVEPAPRVLADRMTQDLSIEDVAVLYGGHPADLGRNMFHVELMSMQGRDIFAARAVARAESIMRATRPGRKAADMGWTEDKFKQVWDAIVRSMGYDLEDISALSPHFAQIESLRNSLHAIYNTSGLPEDTLPALMTWAEDIIRQTEGLPQYNTELYHGWRGEAIDEATELYYRTFTDYTHGNVADAVMRRIFPFWNYEFQRYWWLARTARQYPGTAVAWGRYMTRTNSGYITLGDWDLNLGPLYVHVPSTSFDINPFRSSVLAGGLRRLVMPDYPEYYDTFPQLAEMIDYAGRWGFYPGIHVTLPLAIFGARAGRPQFGESLPSIIATPLNLFTAAFPGSAPARAIRELFFPSHFRDYKIALRASQLGAVGAELYDKVLQGQELDEDEQVIWDEAARGVALMDIMMEQLALFRFRPEELNQLNRETTDLIAEITGISPAMQEEYKRQGVSIYEAVAMPPKYRDLLRQLEHYQNFSRWTTPLLPSEQQQELAVYNEYWDEYRDARERIMTEGLVDPSGRKRFLSIDEMTQEFLNNRMNGKQWSTQQGELLGAFHNHMLQLQSSDRYKNLPFTDEEREEFYRKLGRVPPPVHPLQEMLNLYYDIVPELQMDPETGQYEYDFNTYYIRVRHWERAIPEQYRDEIDEQLNKYRNPLQIFYRDSMMDYFRPYTEVRQFLIESLPEESRQVAVQYYSSSSVEERDALRELTDERGLSIINQLETDVRVSRQNMRLANAVLDARLLFFGRTTDTLTDTAKELYIELCSAWGRTP